MFFPYFGQFIPQQGSMMKKTRTTEPGMKKKRHIFSPEEDEKLKKLVALKGCLKWEEIAKEMDGLNARQCRDRYTNFLDPKIISKPWTKEEEQRLLHLVKVMGNCWVQISKRFKGRTDTQIKNRWNYLKKKFNLNDVFRRSSSKTSESEHDTYPKDKQQQIEDQQIFEPFQNIFDESFESNDFSFIF